MPQLKHNNSILLHKVSVFLFLTLMCYGQVFQLSHLHHFHEDDTVVFEVSYHPADLVVEHSSAHQHGEEESSHPNDTQHSYENQVDWNITRSQLIHALAFDEQNFAFSPVYLSPAGFKKAISFHQKPFFTQAGYSSFSIIRGPPLLG